LLTLTAIDALGGYHAGMTDDEANNAQKLGCGVIYFVFAMITLVTIAFIVFYVPETKGKTPEELTRGPSLTTADAAGERAGINNASNSRMSLDTL